MKIGDTIQLELGIGATIREANGNAKKGLTYTVIVTVVRVCQSHVYVIDANGHEFII